MKLQKVFKDQTKLSKLQRSMDGGPPVGRYVTLSYMG